MGEFLHGIETIEVKAASGIVTAQKTSVICLFGTSPTGDVGKAVLCTTDGEDNTFGTDLSKGAIRIALAAIRKQYAKAIVFVINIKASGTPTTDEFKTALSLIDNIKTNYGYAPKIFIAPGLLGDAGNITSLSAVAEKYRGYMILDAPSDMTYETALTSRGTSGIWNISDYRSQLVFPQVVNTDGTTEYYSPYAAGLRAKVDNEEGFWYSTSNHNVKGISKLATDLNWILGDEDCQVNKLNAIGITTLINVYGSGWREWGNHSAAYPTNSDVRSFLCQQRLDDITSEAIENAALDYLDRPMTKTAIDRITELVNDYFNKLISDGALAPGSACTFDEARNSTDEMSKGHYVWTKTFCGNTPGERFTFYSVIDTNLLSNNL